MNVNNVDRRYKASQLYIKTKHGLPIYKKGAFPFINNILGKEYKWVNKSPKEYFDSFSPTCEALIAIKILNFTGKESFKEIRNRYINLSKKFHPDTGGHPDAFNILNYSYMIFKHAFEIEEDEKENKSRAS